MNKKANTGMGIIILIVAVMIITAVGATYLFKKSGLYINEASVSRGRILDEVKSGVNVETVVTEANDDNKIEGLIITVEPDASSEPIDLTGMVIVIEQGNSTSILKYRNGTLERNISGGYYTE